MTGLRSAKLLGLIVVCLWLAGIIFGACAYQTAPPAAGEITAPPQETTPEVSPSPAISQGSSTAPASTETQPSVSPPPPTTKQPAPPPSSLNVDISGFAFSPASINIPVGAIVTWTNKDSVAHTVTSLTGVFDSRSLSRGASFGYTFNQAGTFEYRCNFHPYMTAKVIVGEGTISQAGGTPPPPPGGSSSGNSGNNSDYDY